MPQPAKISALTSSGDRRLSAVGGRKPLLLPESTTEKQRKAYGALGGLCKEFVSSEENYVLGLQRLLSLYRKPLAGKLEQRPDSTVTTEMLELILPQSDLQFKEKFHSELLVGIKDWTAACTRDRDMGPLAFGFKMYVWW